MQRRSYTYNILIATLFAIVAPSAVNAQLRIAGQPTDDVRIVQSDDAGLTIEFTPRFDDLRPMQRDGRLYQAAGFRHGVRPGTAVAGEPDLQVRTLTLELPGADGNTVAVIGSRTSDTSGIDLSPVPDQVDGEEWPVLWYAVDPARYSQRGFIPERIARLEHVGQTRGVILGSLVLAPLQYDPVQRLLRTYTQVVVRISYGTRASIRSGKDRMTSGVAINGEDIRPEATTVPRRISAVSPGLFSSGVWYRLSIGGSGMYRISGSSLLAAGVPSGVDPSTIKVFGNGGDELPLSPGQPYRDTILENPVAVHDEGTPGVLDAGDYILFYGKGARDWAYAATTGLFSHTINHFTESSVYWVTYGGGLSKKMAQLPSLSDPQPATPLTVTGLVAREDEKVNILSSGLVWMGESFGSGASITYVHPLPGLVQGSTVTYRVNFGARSSAASQFAVYEHGNYLATVPIGGTSIGSYFARQVIEVPTTITGTIPSPDEQSQLRLSFSSFSSTGIGYLDWLEINYQRRLEAQNDLFEFPSADTTGIVEYAIGNFSGTNARIFDVTSPDDIREITGARLSSDSCVFQVQLTQGGIRKFIVLGPAAFRSPGSLTSFANQDLRGDTSFADEIIVTHRDFLAAAQRLKAHRERPGDDYIRTKVVTVDDIANEFGSGIISPMAIRNYLRYAHTQWTPAPRYVLLFGDGDFDCKGNIPNTPDRVPSWQTYESYRPLFTYASDDDFVTFSTSGRVDMGCGRLTAQSVEQAQTFVDKIIQYETGSIADPWKIRTTFVADDGPAGPNEDNGNVHTKQAEEVSQLVPHLFDRKKIFLYEYPTVISSSGRRKPDVNVALRDAINQGTLVLNYTGHGNPRLWAHEQIFVRETDFPYLANSRKYFFLMAATCNYSAFDALSEQSSGELLAVKPDAGAIAVFSATRAVFSFDNAQLNETFYRNMFQADSSGHLIPQRIGDIVYRTKQIHTGDNDRKYFLLGDPALSIAFPKRLVTIDSINGIASTDTAQLQALGRATIVASVRGSVGVDTTYSGAAAILSVFDAAKTIQITDPGAQGYTYRASGDVLFRGENSVSAGVVRGSFVVPRDIAYTNGIGRISIYVADPQGDGAGYTSNIRVGGTDSTVTQDTTGPTIAIYLDGRSFRPGDVVSAHPTLIVDLHDENGINTSGSGLGHRIEAWLDGSTESVDLTSFYRSRTDTYQEGVVEYLLQGLAEGSHTLRIKVWDTYNNSSVAQTAFDIMTGTGLTITDVFPYPNPAVHGTYFTLRHNQLTPVDVTVKVYTVAGRLLYSVSSTTISDQEVKIPWDLRDGDGDMLANGTYLYKVMVRTSDGRFSGEALGKVSILK